MTGQPSHAHPHGHAHGHNHAHGHEHGDGHGKDMWSGEEYLKRPGVKETAVVSHESVIYALTSTGLMTEDISKLNLLEVGCGAGAVTQHYAQSFASVHAIDTSPSMLLSLSDHLPPQTTYSLHFLSPNSPSQFANSSYEMYSPTREDNERKIQAPRSQFDVITANLVVHHIDDLDGFMQGVMGLLAPGGWVVFTEFGVEDDGRDVAEEHRHKAIKEGKKNDAGSVNQPGHFHPAFTTQTIIDLLTRHGLEGVHAETRGRLPVWENEADWPACLIARGRKP